MKSSSELPRTYQLDIPPTKKCLFCSEEILLTAIKCKHCGSDTRRKPDGLAHLSGLIPFLILAIMFMFEGLLFSLYVWKQPHSESEGTSVLVFMIFLPFLALALKELYGRSDKMRDLVQIGLVCFLMLLAVSFFSEDSVSPKGMGRYAVLMTLRPIVRYGFGEFLHGILAVGALLALWRTKACYQ